MKRILLLAALIGISATAVHSRTIDWGSSVGGNILDSNGNALDDSYTFELGSFGSFIPTGDNLDQWQSNWKVFDRAVAPDGWNSSASYFASSATLLNGGISDSSPPLPAYSFAPNEQAYIFIYNAFNAMDLLSEWALITNDGFDLNSADDWRFPIPGDKTDMPLEWRVSEASTVIYGGVNNQQGAGNYTVDPANFDLQTHAVPEPAGALLIAITGFLTLLRRRRTR
ncbi:MAG: PEP-CTERM sorting domain-containing protein [Verrucomicrobiota bacterium]